MHLYYRHVFRQRHALNRYLAGDLPSFEDLRRGLFLLERTDDVRRPDHFLRNAEQLSTGRFDTLPALLDGTLRWMAQEHLEPNGAPPLCVRRSKFARWQDVITDVPPLVVVARGLLDRVGRWPDPLRGGAANELLERWIEPQVRYSALPTVHEPRLEHLIRVHGLDEMHMHLNGSTEVEHVWLGALSKPRAFAGRFFKGQSKRRPVELLQQDDQGLTHAGFVQRLRLAARLRHLLAHQALLPAQPLEMSLNNLKALLQSDDPRSAQTSFVANEHPVTTVFGISQPTRLSLETLLMMAVLRQLSAPPGDAPGPWYPHALYVYLLLFAQFQRLLVQQRDQYGFDQFQKITENEMRELTEEKYLDRLHQLTYTPQGDLDLLEGRYAPKETPEKMAALIGNILIAYQRFHGRDITEPTLRRLLDGDEEAGEATEWVEPPGKRLRLGLVGHFIKKPDKDGQPCRYFRLRREVHIRRRAIEVLVNRHPRLRRYLTGFDAAANETEAPPEVFAPVFRQLRHAGFWNFSYHVGEDFVHLLSGIRAVYEALTFLDLSSGNRIGHATAVGIEPKLWGDAIGPEVVMRLDDRLDDLVVARRLLRMVGETGRVIVEIDSEISQLCQRLYQRLIDPDSLHDAWRLRHLDPLSALGLWGRESDLMEDCLISEHRLVREAQEHSPEAYRQFLSHHDPEVIRRGSVLITVPSFGAADISLTRRLQDVVLQEFHDRDVAIETLPTSNVRISMYSRHAEHHIFRWLGLRGPCPPVAVVVGSDDPGIFATNLRNEYAHLMRELDVLCSENGQATALVERLITNGKIYRFSPDR